jgi:fructose-1-phosphate kinase PfkB-like protein
VYGPVLGGFSVGSGDSFIAGELYLRQEKERIQMQLRSALARYAPTFPLLPL